MRRHTDTCAENKIANKQQQTAHSHQYQTPSLMCGVLLQFKLQQPYKCTYMSKSTYSHLLHSTNYLRTLFLQNKERLGFSERKK